jgi:hypothetical protein
MNEVDRALAGMGEGRSAYRVLVGKPERRRPLGILRLRWENDIKMNLHELGLGDMDGTDLAEDRERWRVLVNMAMNLRVP